MAEKEPNGDEFSLSTVVSCTPGDRRPGWSQRGVKWGIALDEILVAHDTHAK